MFQSQIGLYLGKQPENGFIGFITNPSFEKKEEIFYFIFSFPDGVNQEKGHRILNQIKEDLLKISIGSLNQLEQIVDEIIKKYNFPAIFSLAAIVLTKEEIVYLKTSGQGCIYLKRGNRFVKIIDGNNIASGYLNDKDYLFLTSVDLVKKVEEEKIKKFIDDYVPVKFVEELNNYLVNQENQGLIGALIKFYFLKEEAQENIETTIVQNVSSNKSKINLFINQILNSYRDYKEKVGRQKIITLFLTIIISLALIWSVGFGVKRRQEALKQKKIKTAQELIVQKLEEAEETAFLNLEKARSLVEEGKKELSVLKKELRLNDNKDKAIIELEQLIKEKENKIFRKEEKKYTEFYDLTIDQKQAAGLRLSLINNLLIILDKNQGLIYTLSLDKKSLKKLVDEKIKKSNLITASTNKVFYYLQDEGVYSISEETKPKKVIAVDNDWGKIVEIFSYNNNLYLLDSEKNQIYKYIAGEEGYGNKLNYLKSTAFKLTEANSMAIDSSIYVGFPTFIVKFTLGEEDEFANDLPKEPTKFKKIYTNKETEKIYAWDKEQGKIYILTKNGRYERQIYSSILKKITDFVVYQNSAYLLLSEKILIVELD